jgi:hypothetical protein
MLIMARHELEQQYSKTLQNIPNPSSRHMTLKTPKTFSAKPFTAKQISRRMPSRVAPAPHRSWLYATAMMLTLTAAGALLAMRAQAQTPEPDAVAPAQATPSPAAAPKYAAKDMAMAFSYMDANKDGKVSREEAAGFRGVARHFDEADTNRDGFLSSQEFESALNGRRPQ